MSRSLIILIFVILLGCDTSESVEPRNEKFFVKLIGVEDDDYGNDVIQAADGGYVIVGRHESSDAVASNFLIIKTDRSGNTEWINTDIQEGEAVSVVEVNGSFVVGGTVGTGDERRSVVLKVNSTGSIVGVPVIIETVDDNNTQYFNELRKITNGPSGLSVSGVSGLPKNPTQINPQGFMALLEPTDLSRKPYIDDQVIEYFGTDGQDNIIGVFESSFNDEVSYLALGSSKGTSGGDQENFFYVLMNEAGTPSVSGPTPFALSGNQIATAATFIDDTYYIVGYTDFASLAQTALVRLDLVVDNGLVAVVSDRGVEVISASATNFDTYARGVDLRSVTSKVIVSDVGVIDQTDEVVRSTTTNVQALDANNNVKWNREFGTLSRNYASAVIVDDEGFIITVGTNDLDSQFKVVLIKTGANGQMSF